MTTMYAKHILDVLEDKHSKDVFVSECKSGPTHFTEHMRMDAWVMNRSWAHPCYTAYEIKVSRSDFLNDKKWRAYLPYCNEFFFVAPKGLISTDELPPEAGLLELLGGASGKRLVRRKQAAWRDVTPPESLFKYVLMARVKVGRSEWHIEQTKEERADRWRQFVADRIENRTLGSEVSQAIYERAKQLESNAKHLEAQMSAYDDIRRFLSQIGVDPDHHVSRWTVEDKLKRQEELFPPDFVWSMEHLRNQLDEALRKLKPDKEVEVV